MWIAGSILVLLAIGLVIGSFSQKNKAYLIQSTDTSTAKALQEGAADVAKEIGAGSFNQITEVKGNCVCDNPLTSELAQRECVYYSMRVTREYEEDYWDTDSEGRRVQRTRRSSETVANNSNSTPFYVQDATGRVRVDPSGASFTTEKVLSRFEPRATVERGNFRLGSFLFDVATRGMSNHRTIGYRYEEEIIPVGRRLYVLGEASDRDGEVSVIKPSKKNTQFIVSVKSEEELVSGAKKAALWCNIGGIVSLLAGAAFFILYFVMGIDFFSNL
jgi:hypothetical protein